MANTRKRTRSRKAAKRRTRRTKSRKSHGGARKRKSTRRRGGAFDPDQIKKLQENAKKAADFANKTGMTQAARNVANIAAPELVETANELYGNAKLVRSIATAQ